jgi:hypothetical protein
MKIKNGLNKPNNEGINSSLRQKYAYISIKTAFMKTLEVRCIVKEW